MMPILPRTCAKANQIHREGYYAGLLGLNFNKYAGQPFAGPVWLAGYLDGRG